MSEIAIFELNSQLTTKEIAEQLSGMRLPSDVSELTDAELSAPDICQSKRIEVYVRVYQATEDGDSVVRELKRIAEYLLSVSDGEVFYYRSSHAQEKDAEEEVISVTDLELFPPTLHEPYTKRYVIKRRQSGE